MCVSLAAAVGAAAAAATAAAAAAAAADLSVSCHSSLLQQNNCGHGSALRNALDDKNATNFNCF